MNKTSSLHLWFIKQAAIFVHLFVFTTSVFAQGVDLAEEVGRTSAATLIAAALESMGYKAQEIVFRDFGTELNLLAALIFVIAAVRLIFTIILDRKYLPALWMLMGPILFFVLTSEKTRVQANAVDWQFSESTTTNEAGSTGGSETVREILNNQPDTGRDNKASTGGKVAWFFHEYNRLVSIVIRELVGVFIDAPAENHFIFGNRMSMYKAITGSMEIAIDPELSGAVNDTLSQCVEAISQARAIVAYEREGRDSAEVALLKAKYEEKKKAQRVKLDPKKDTLKYYARKLDKVQGKTGNGYKSCFYLAREDDQLQNKPWLGFEKGIDDAFFGVGDSATWYAVRGNGTDLNTISLTCEQSWVLMGIALADTVLEKLYDLEKGIREQLPTEEQQKKFDCEGKSVTNDEESFGWMAAQRNMSSNPEIKGLLKVYNDIDNKLSMKNSDVSLIPVIVGGYMIRNYMFKHGKGGIRGDNLFRNLNMQYLPPAYDIMADQDSIIDMYYMNIAWKERTYAMKRDSLYAYALAIPYLQGAFLYVLAFTYPFFALIVLWPGRANFFFTWMTLWAWIKSWDVGWAAMMIIDRALWEVMPKSSTFDQTSDPGHGPLSMMESAFSGDYAYSQDMYMTLMAFLIMSVPIFMGRLILAGKGAAFASLSEKFESKMSGTVGRTSGRIKTADLVSKAHWVNDMAMATCQSQFFHTMRDQLVVREDEDLKEVSEFLQSAEFQTLKTKEEKDKAFEEKMKGMQLIDPQATKTLNEMGVNLDDRTIDTINTRYANSLKLSLHGSQYKDATTGAALHTLVDMKVEGATETNIARQSSSEKIRLLESLSQLAMYRAQKSHVYIRGEKFRAIGGRVEAFDLPKGNYGVWEDAKMQQMEINRGLRDQVASRALQTVAEGVGKGTKNKTSIFKPWY